MILTHWSPQPFVLDRERTYSQEEFGNGKPRGLWLSDESDLGWKEWCESEQWGVGTLAHSTQFEPVEDHGLLVITSVPDLRQFTALYCGHPVFRGTGGTSLGSHWIDWERVAAKYTGIVISPYQWSARMDLDMMWYYGWDVASACVWNLDAIRPVEVTV
ncbi:hypothetical protein PBI_TEAMOCIL_11 [Microbacterium phage Teamocil]|uniref:Uncharacterized protein n=1 Tax=Microbacterium phage Teamocil TaxID=2656554 RepID=A0A649VZI6_9CAUD|nr:hypothetical protein QDA12_gp11 [Microbacterium phage Teamocil]QGJ88866.1 hypothetical protein PBI_GINA_11 [Microbacterium phage Gina]QGJ96963.1 hypothetical protein PBI_TEAMOCIL_11 [Microbacterium phage Teamocil]